MWYSLHGYIHDFNTIDSYLQTEFNQVVESGLEKYFFIRYWLGGPHIRLRFQCEPEEYSKMKQRFQDSITRFLQNETVNLIDYENYYHQTMLEKENIKETYWCDHGSVIEFEYEPEYERYGGKGVMSNSEHVFYKSSLLANMLNKLPYGKRIITGLDLIYLTFKKAGAGKEIYREYAEFWREYASNGIDMKQYKVVLKDRLNRLQHHHKEQYAIYNDYFNSLEEMKIMSDPSILMSHIHMTNNRIGITPAFEYYLASFIAENIEMIGEAIEQRS